MTRRAAPRRLLRALQPLALTLAAALPQPAPAQTAADSARLAASALERATEALGGRAAVLGTTAWEVRLMGATLAPGAGQAWSPSASHSATQIRRRLVVDAAGGRGIREGETDYPGPVRFHTLAGVDSSGGWSVDLARWRTGDDVQRVSGVGARAALGFWTRMLPHGALRQALAAGDGARHLGTQQRDGRAVEAVSFPAGGQTVTLWLDAGSAYPVGVAPGEFPGSTLEFSDYAPSGGLQVPRHWVQRAGGLVEDARVVAFEASAALPADLLALPDGYADVPAGGTPRAVRLAEGVFVAEGMPGGYRTAWIVTDGGVSVFDAPQNAQFADLTGRLIRESVGDLPVRQVLVSHHHSDHVGGLATWVGGGATVVTTSEAAEALRRQLPDSLRDAARFQTVDERATLGSGAGRVEAFHVANEHAATSLAFFHPASATLLQGDLFYLPERGPVPPAFAVTSDLERALRRNGIVPARIVGIHGRAGTMAELAESLARRDRPGR